MKGPHQSLKNFTFLFIDKKKFVMNKFHLPQDIFVAYSEKATVEL